MLPWIKSFYTRRYDKPFYQRLHWSIKQMRHLHTHKALIAPKWQWKNISIHLRIHFEGLSWYSTCQTRPSSDPEGVQGTQTAEGSLNTQALFCCRFTSSSIHSIATSNIKEDYFLKMEAQVVHATDKTTQFSAQISLTDHGYHDYMHDLHHYIQTYLISWLSRAAGLYYLTGIISLLSVW